MNIRDFLVIYGGVPVLHLHFSGFTFKNVDLAAGFLSAITSFASEISGSEISQLNMGTANTLVLRSSFDENIIYVLVMDKGSDEELATEILSIIQEEVDTRINEMNKNRFEVYDFWDKSVAEIEELVREVLTTFYPTEEIKGVQPFFLEVKENQSFWIDRELPFDIRNQLEHLLTPYLDQFEEHGLFDGFLPLGEREVFAYIVGISQPNLRLLGMVFPSMHIVSILSVRSQLKELAHKILNKSSANSSLQGFESDHDLDRWLDFKTLLIDRWQSLGLQMVYDPTLDRFLPRSHDVTPDLTRRILGNAWLPVIQALTTKRTIAVVGNPGDIRIVLLALASLTSYLDFEIFSHSLIECDIVGIPPSDSLIEDYVRYGAVIVDPATGSVRGGGLRGLSRELIMKWSPIFSLPPQDARIYFEAHQHQIIAKAMALLTELLERRQTFISLMESIEKDDRVLVFECLKKIIPHPLARLIPIS